MSFRRSLIAVGVGLSIVLSVAWAEGKGLKEGVEGLFEAGWSRSVKARGDAEQRYEQLRKQAPDDVRIPYAYALIQLRQLRYPDAAKLLGEVLRSDKKNLTAWKLKAWLSMLTKEYDAAMSEMQRVADLMPGEQSDDEAETTYSELASVLGRMVGFLEGPAKEGVDAARLADCRQKIAARLTSARRLKFDEGRRSVVEQHAGAAEEAEQTGAAAEEEAAKRKEKMLQDLEHKAEETAAQAEAEQKRVEEVKKQLEYELDKVASEDRAVVEQGRQIETQVVGVRRELQVLDERTAYLLDRADHTDDPHDKQMLLDEATVMRARRQRPLMVLADLDRRYAALNAQRAGLVQRSQDIQNQYQRETGRVDKLHGTLDRIRKDRGKVQGQTVTGNTPQVRDQKKRSVSLTTYVPLPLSLDNERDRLLESF